MAPTLLLLAAVVLASPLSTALAAARWPARMPVPALVLWQSVCLAAGLCAIGAGAVVALQPLGSNLFSATRKLLGHVARGHPTDGMTGHGIVAGTLAGAAALLLLVVLLRSAVVGAAGRRAHRRVLDLLTGPRADDSVGPAITSSVELLADVRILDHDRAVAYTVPGWHARVVLSVGLVDLLSGEELTAVVDHERAHVRSRHDLLVLPFQAWATTLGWVPGVRAAAAAVGELVEMQADDLAAERSSPRVLGRALARVALAGPSAVAWAPGQSLDDAGAFTTSVSRRVSRLERAEHPSAAAVAVVYLAAALLLAGPGVALLVGWR